MKHDRTFDTVSAYGSDAWCAATMGKSVEWFRKMRPTLEAIQFRSQIDHKQNQRKCDRARLAAVILAAFALTACVPAVDRADCTEGVSWRDLGRPE